MSEKEKADMLRSDPWRLALALILEDKRPINPEHGKKLEDSE